MSDTISRQAAIRWVKTECNPYGKPTLDYESGKRVMKHLEQMPSAQPERKTGKWNTYCHGDIDFSHSCNQCGYSAPYQMIGGEFFQKKWNFCPNCGADMRGEQDD